MEGGRGGGRHAELVSLEARIQGFDHYDKADIFQVDRVVSEVTADDYDGLVLPGGIGNPDASDRRGRRALRADLRRVGQAGRRDLPRSVDLVEADVVRDRTLTSFQSIRTDVKNAGGNWVDREVVVDDGLISSRNPDDLPAFCKTLVEVLPPRRRSPDLREGAAILGPARWR